MFYFSYIVIMIIFVLIFQLFSLWAHLLFFGKKLLPFSEYFFLGIDWYLLHFASCNYLNFNSFECIIDFKFIDFPHYWHKSHNYHLSHSLHIEEVSFPYIYCITWSLLFIRYPHIYWLLILGTLFKDCLSDFHKFVNGNFWLVFWYIMVPVFKISMIRKWNWVIGRGRKDKKKNLRGVGGWCRSIHSMDDDDMAYWGGTRCRLGLWCDVTVEIQPLG